MCWPVVHPYETWIRSQPSLRRRAQDCEYKADLDGHKLIKVQDRLVHVRAARPGLETLVEDGCAGVICAALRAIVCGIVLLPASLVSTTDHGSIEVERRKVAIRVSRRSTMCKRDRPLGCGEGASGAVPEEEGAIEDTRNCTRPGHVSRAWSLKRVATRSDARLRPDPRPTRRTSYSCHVRAHVHSQCDPAPSHVMATSHYPVSSARRTGQFLYDTRDADDEVRSGHTTSYSTCAQLSMH